MNYRNGREALNGDKVVLVPANGVPVVGVLYDAEEGSNGKLAMIHHSDSSPNLGECLHLDDVLEALKASESLKAKKAEAPEAKK